MNKRIFLSAPHMSGNELKYIEKVFESNYGVLNMKDNTISPPAYKIEAILTQTSGETEIY